MSVRAPTRVVGGGESGTLYVFANFDINELNNTFLVPTAYAGGRYTVGTIHVVSRLGTFAAVNITPMGSNDPEYSTAPTAHPGGTAITVNNTPTVGLSLDYWWFGGYVSVVEGSAANADIYVMVLP